jgi:GTP cyclohydrolase II
MARAGRGVLFYLIQEGRGAGLSAKARDRMIVQASGHRVTTFEAFAAMGLPVDLRTYEEVAPIARLLGIRAPLRLLTNNPDKAASVASALADEKIEICGTQPIQGPDSPFNGDYLDAKERSGHVLDRSAGLPVELAPEPVRVEPPMEAVGAPHLVSTAQYLLPVAIEGEFVGGARRRTLEPRDVDWFRLRVVLDRRTAREWIVLSQPVRPSSDAVGGAETATEMRGDECHRMDLIDRLPSRAASGRAGLHASLRSIRRKGAGGVVIGFDESGFERDRIPTQDLERRRRLAREILAATWPANPGESRAGAARDHVAR